MRPQHKRSSLLTEYGNETTIHGVHYLIEGGRYSKLFWTVTMLLCSIILLYNCIVIALDFLESPQVTNVRTSYVTDFPPLMYCPMGTVTTTEAIERYNLTALDIVFLNDFFMGPRTYGPNNSTFFRDWINEESVSMLHAKNTLRLKKLGMNTAQFLKHISGHVEIKAAFDNETGHQPRVPLDYWLNVTYYGICFNLLNRAIARQGQFPTLLTLKIPSFSHVMPTELRVYYSYGLLFMGDNVQSFQPTMPVYIKDGRENYVEMKETRIESKSSARQPCTSEKGYIAANRVYDCFDNVTWPIANCTSLRDLYQTARTKHTCHQMMNRAELNEAYYAGFGLCVDSHVEKHMSCSQVMFEATVTDVECVAANTTALFIQYRFAMILQIEEQNMYTWQRFLSNIGGLISLLCGASVISLAQILYFLTRGLTSVSTATMQRSRAKRRQASSYRRKNFLTLDLDPDNSPNRELMKRQQSCCLSPPHLRNHQENWPRTSLIPEDSSATGTTGFQCRTSTTDDGDDGCTFVRSTRCRHVSIDRRSTDMCDDDIFRFGHPAYGLNEHQHEEKVGCSIAAPLQQNGNCVSEKYDGLTPTAV